MRLMYRKIKFSTNFVDACIKEKVYKFYFVNLIILFVLNFNRSKVLKRKMLMKKE